MIVNPSNVIRQFSKYPREIWSSTSTSPRNNSLKKYKNILHLAFINVRMHLLVDKEKIIMVLKSYLKNLKL